jgi:hypothetical protein
MMNCNAIPSQYLCAENWDFGCPKNASTGLLKIAGFFALLIHLFGCASTGMISDREQAAVDAGEKAIVLLRIHCTIDNQQCEPFINPTFTADPIIFFGLGAFETVGEPRFSGHRFLSEESRRAGWTYFVLSPEVYYLAVIGPDSSAMSKASDSQYFREAPRWRIDVPENAKLIYVGTLQLEGKSDGKLLFGGKIVRPISSDEVTLTNEHELASSLLAEYFPDVGETKTILMQRWRRGDPVIIRSPMSNSTN